jgi:hypothetical protein
MLEMLRRFLMVLRQYYWLGGVLLRNWVYQFLGNMSCRLWLVYHLSSWGESFFFSLFLPSSSFFLPASFDSLRNHGTSLQGLNVGSTPHPLLLVPCPLATYLSIRLPILHLPSSPSIYPLSLPASSHTRFARVRATLTTSIGPAFAIPAVLTKAGISKDDVDFYEINEAFASQAVMSIQHLHLPYEKVSLSCSTPFSAIAAVSCR